VLADVLPYLCCPHCGAELADGPSLTCGQGHVFDVAKQGYVSLLSGRSAVSGDSAEMVAARDAFLSAGHYAPIVRAVVAATEGAGCVLDLGAGTGHYLAAVLAAAPARVGIALEISKPALRRAARAHPRLGAVGADTWRRLPIRDGSIAVVLNVFAPRNAAELARVLTDDGRLVVVSPTQTHLAELVSALDLLTVAPDKAEKVTASLPGFVVSEVDDVEFALSLGQEDVRTLVGMGPSAWHVDEATLRERVAALDMPVRVTASVTVTSYTRG